MKLLLVFAPVSSTPVPTLPPAPPHPLAYLVDRYVKFTPNDMAGRPYLTEGRSYRVLKVDDTHITIKNDNGKACRYVHRNFSINLYSGIRALHEKKKRTPYGW